MKKIAKDLNITINATSINNVDDTNAFKEKEAYELQNKFLEDLSIKNDMISVLNLKKCRSKQIN